MLRRLFVIIGFFLAVASTPGQDSPPDQAEQQRILLDRIQQLEKRVSELEAKAGVSPTPTLPAPGAQIEQMPESQPAAAAQAPSPGPAHEHEARDQQAAVRQVETHYPSLQVRGFADVNFSATDQKGVNSGFNLGQLVLHLASPLSRIVKSSLIVSRP